MPMERMSRAVVLASVAAGCLGYAWLASLLVSPFVAGLAVGAFALSLAIAIYGRAFWATPALGFAFIFPGLSFALGDTTRYHAIVVWLAMLAAPVFAERPLFRWRLPGLIAIGVAGWAMVLAVTWPVIALREVDFSLVAAQTLDTPNGLRAGPPPHVAGWVVSMALSQMLGLLWLDTLWGRYGRDRLAAFTREIVLPLIAGALVGAAAGIYQWAVDLAWANPGDWPSLGRAGGLMLDANTFGVSCAILGPLTLILAIRATRSQATLAMAALLLAVGMWISGSRTALLVMTAGLIGALTVVLRRLGPWQARLIPVGCLTLAGALVLAAVVVPRSERPSNPLERLIATLPAPTGEGVVRFARDMYERNGYGIAAAAAIREHTLAGVGIGAFNPLSSDFYFETSGIDIQPDNAQNWWRHQLVELGIVGAVPVMAVFALILAVAVGGQAAEDGREIATAVKSLLVGVALASLLGVPTQHPATWLAVIALVYGLFAVTTSGLLDRDAPRAGWRAAWLIAILVAGMQMASARTTLRVPMRAERFGFQYEYGFSAPSQGPSGEFRWTARHAVAVVPAQGRQLELEIWVMHPDVGARPVKVQLQKDDEIVMDQTVSAHGPFTYLLAVQPGRPFTRFELDVSRTFGDGRGLLIGARWLPGSRTGSSRVP
ncbi:MAG: hypothetical protein AB1635_00735 [Acidobacteriota bacterium]